MIYEKKLSAPAFNRRNVRRKISLFQEKSGAISAYGLHFKQTEEGIVCAEGADFLQKRAPRLFASEGHARIQFTHDNSVIASSEGVFPFSYEPNALVCFVTKENERKFIAVCAEGSFELFGNHSDRIGEGGTCAAIFGERLFTADGYRLSWTAPFELTEETSGTQGAGHADLPSADGEILRVCALGEELFLVRERGIAKLQAKGDTLGFVAAHVPFSGGKIRKGTVQNCGAQIKFLTESGLFSFDGSRCAHQSSCGFSALDLSETATAACGGNYYATASFEGERCIWCVSEEGGHLIRARAEQLSGGEDLRFLAEGKIYALTERGLPAMHRKDCLLKTEYSLLGLSSRQKYLDGILVEGKGRFHVSARGESGLPRSVYGKAGEKLRFPLPVKGRGFSVEVGTLDEDACLKALVFDLREETGKW